MTPEATTPEPGSADNSTPDTYDEQVEGIADLLDEAPETPDRRRGDEAQDADEGLSLDDPDAEDAGQVEADEPDGPEEPAYKGGRFAADDAKVRMEDGSTITIAELKRNNLYQRGFTEKTTALAREKEQFEAQRQQVDQYAQSLAQQRDYIQWFAENYLPKAPDPSEMQTDPMGYLRRKEAWEQANGVLNYFQQAKEQQAQLQQYETAQQRKQRVQEEWNRLLERAPELKDDTKRLGFFNAAIKGAQEHYGFSEHEVKAIEDHRMILALKDALAYRRLKSKAPQMTQPTQKRSAMPTGGKRAAPGAADARAKQARSERLRNSGRLEDGIASLMDFDL